MVYTTSIGIICPFLNALYIFSQKDTCLLTLSMVPFVIQKSLILIQSTLLSTSLCQVMIRPHIKHFMSFTPHTLMRK